jgi:hypothetical protein
MEPDIVRQAEEIVTMAQAGRSADAAKRVIGTLGFTGLDGVWHACYRQDASGQWARTRAYEEAIRDGILPLGAEPGAIESPNYDDPPPGLLDL